MTTLQKRIHILIRSILGSGPAAWLVWCDPHGHWLPLLNRVAADRRMGEFALVEVTERTSGIIGGPVTRQELQQRLDTNQSFVLYVPAAPSALGWLWAQALLAERIYDASLRAQLMEWGWRPHSLTVSDEEVAALALTNLQSDPADWGGGGLQPDREKLLEVLAGLAEPEDENRLALDLAVEEAGLPPLDEADLPGWRRQALALLLVTQAHSLAPELVSEGHERVLPLPARQTALALLRRWEDSVRLANNLPEAILQADPLAALPSLLAAADLGHGPFLSHAAEKTIFANTCRGLAQREGRSLVEQLADLHGAIERHRRGFWGYRTAPNASTIPWGELARLSDAAGGLLAAAPSRAWATPREAIDWYIGGGWRLDQAGEEIERGLEAVSPELTGLIGPLRQAWRARWEETAIGWSACWTQAGCPTPAHLATVGGWLQAELAASDTPTAILTVDALRFALGAGLAEQIDRQEGVERARVAAARAPLPSITALGMATALPIPEEQLEASVVAGKWEIRQRGSDANLSVAQARRNWWTAQPHTQVVEGIGAVLNGTIPEPTARGQRLVVYDGAIDRLGHDDELALQGSGAVIQRYVDAIQRLRDGGWRRILVVTDHGFIRWSGSQERNAPLPAPQPVYSSRRAVAYPAETQLAGPQALAPGGRLRVGFPHGAACFRTYGGLGYFHGGASLQEWILPALVVEWPQTAQPVVVGLAPLERVLSQRPKVTLTVGAASLLAEENIPRTVAVVIRSRESQVILFRSESITITGAEVQEEVTLEVEDEVSAERNTPLLVQVRDARTEAVLAEVESRLLIELGGW